MTFATNDMTFVVIDMTIWCHTHKQKVSYYDKNASALWQQTESAGYVKVRLIAGPLRRNQHTWSIPMGAHNKNTRLHRWNFITSKIRIQERYINARLVSSFFIKNHILSFFKTEYDI